MSDQSKRTGGAGEQNQAVGISRGDRSTNTHAIVDSKGRRLNFAVTGGQVHEQPGRLRPPLVITADKAYTSRNVR
jgi:hypothetical protein